MIPARPPEHVELMTVGTDEVVVTFTTEPGRSVVTRVGGREVTTQGPYHVARVAELAPDVEYELTVEGAAHDEWFPRRVRTLPRPPGELVSTVATVNDVHFGETECGLTGDRATDAVGPILRAAPGEPPYPVTMGRAAVAEIAALGADAAVVKGDLTACGLAEQYESFLATYGQLGARLHYVRGNHDAIHDPALAVEKAPYTVRLPGVTLAVLDTTVPGAVGGDLPPDQIAWLDDLGADATNPVLVFGHHPVWNLDTSRRVDPDYAIARAASEALLDVFARRVSIAGYFAGHTHTNRVRRYSRAPDVPCVEVACAKDYPGAWSEYRIYEGGYTQVMRRISAPAALAWSERCRAMIQGVYRDLVLGPIEQRCFTQPFRG